MSPINPVVSTVALGQPWAKSWPANELERVSVCPVCGSAAREVLHEGLIDNVLFVAPGRWTMHRCTQCRSAYLDPRPNQASIGKAYGTYYTHDAGMPRAEANQLSGFRRWRRILANGYTNHRYGTNHQPASVWGIWVARLLLRQREAMDVQFRYLPKPEKGQRLLDIGCGNGDFLANAKHAGWDVLGLEPDPKAAQVAQQRGLDVRVGTIALLGNEAAYFDAITLSHVIEHVHSPQDVLTSVHRLLKLGGFVYVDTPNIDSSGAKRFGTNWRGLETPRHLVLFNTGSLQQLLMEIGFDLIKIKRRTAVMPGMYLSSLQMKHGKSPYGAENARLSMMARIKMKALSPKTGNLEFITLTAEKCQ